MNNHITDADEIRNVRFAVESEIKKKKLLNQPIARFDPKTKEIYFEYSDGRREFFGEAMKDGRYAERTD